MSRADGLGAMFERSLVARLGGAIAAIALLAVLGMAVSGMVALSTQGSGAAINLAGSLRMQSWHMASLYQAGRDPMHRRELSQAVDSFETTLKSHAITGMLSGSGEAGLAESYAGILKAWNGTIRPRLLGGTTLTEGTQADAMLRETGDFVDRIDLFVKQMEEATEAKILVMQVVLGAALVVTVLVVLLTVHLIHNGLVKPLHALLGVTDKAGRGDLSVRTDYTGDDELGRLGASFNEMAGDLAKLYQNLEARVEQKTEELTRSNRSLELLYHSIAKLHGSPPGRDTYLAVLRDIETVLGVGHGIVCLGEPGGHSGQAIATTMRRGDANPCTKAECIWCHGTETPRVSIKDDGRQLLTLPLSDAERQYGVLIIDVPPGMHPEAWQVQLLEALSRHIGVAIGAERRIEQSRKLGLLEERAVIARELHDSLAQSLAYMKIQVSRMQGVLGKPERATEMAGMLAELREGLSGAYRQLRELLSTFRLKMEGGDLRVALENTVAEFAERGDIDIGLSVEHRRCPLSPNEEIHVLHIVREALSNVLNHAHARHAEVRIACAEDGMLAVGIEDDGVGIGKSAALHHYGMTIMEERARTLRGEIAFLAREPAGSRVLLRFHPASQRVIPIVNQIAA
jgi:two-component system nitrate/nitrite sensor histidine kinase NarX